VKCFVHKDIDAVAACKHCVKGLCHECVVVSEGGCSCGGTCADEVAFMNAMLGRSKRALAGSANVVRMTGWFLVVSGVAMCAWGVLSDYSSFPILMGAVFIVCGLIGMRLRKPFTPPENATGQTGNVDAS